MKQIKKSLAILLALMMCVSLLTIGSLAEEAPELAAPAEGDIVVIYTNDVHNVLAASGATDAGNPNLSRYAKLAAYVNEMTALVGDSNLTLVDAGDALQGEAIGSITEGGALAGVLNELGYDIFVPGNHEFDYGMARMQELMGMLDAKVISANFVDLAAGKPVYDGYTVVDYGSVKIGFVGMTTPESFFKSTPVYFQNEAGEYIYGFCQDAAQTGKDLYAAIQGAVDAAIAEGADYVIAVGHMGVDAVSAPYRSLDVIANTTGINVFIDGHSHTVMEGDMVANKAGAEVLLTQTGTKLANIGRLVIAADGTITSALIATDEYENSDEAALKYLTDVEESVRGELSTAAGSTSVDLVVNDPATGSRMVRSRETNLGDLCADAYRYVLDADIGFVNGGGIRTSIMSGDFTLGQVISVHPFGNAGCVVEATGQQIIDALEMSSRGAGASEVGGFLQVSGLEYTINSYIPHTVKIDEYGMFVEVTGDRRVTDVKVGGEDIVLDKAYSLASHNYMLLNSGDGLNMFKDNEVLVQPVMLDNQILIKYIADYLDGVVGDDYADPYGQGRIKIVDTYSDLDKDEWYFGAVSYTYNNKIIPGVNYDEWAPDTLVDVATAIEAMYNLEGRPAVTGDGFADVGQSDWFYNSALWAKNIGLALGDDQGVFNGTRSITRAEQAAIFVRYLEIKGYILESADVSSFSDAGDIPSWFAEEGIFEKVVGAGIMHGTNENMLLPTETARRCELAQLLLNIKNFIDGLDYAVGHVGELIYGGNLQLNITGKVLFNKGFAIGDILTVTVGDLTLDMPFCPNYGDVDAFSPLVRLSGGRASSPVIVAGNMGTFANKYGVGAVGDPVYFRLKETGGYSEELASRLTEAGRTNERDDYESDEIFANFREVTLGDIAPGVLYRASSPINNTTLFRASYANALSEAAGIATFINLADTDESIEALIAGENFDSEYYAKLWKDGQVIALGMGVDFFYDAANRAQLKLGLEFMLEKDGPYLIHCNEGKDRAGFTLAMLESLMGAKIDEIKDDFMCSYVNYFRFEKGEGYDKFAASALYPQLCLMAGVEIGSDLSKVDLVEGARGYLLGLGLDEAQIDSLVLLLAGG